MPTPMFNVRLSPKVQTDLREMSKVFGSPTPSSFAREILETVCSGDLEKVKAFTARLIAKQGEQLTLKLNAVIDAATGQKPAQKPRKAAGRVKGAPRRGKRAK